MGSAGWGGRSCQSVGRRRPPVAWLPLSCVLSVLCVTHRRPRRFPRACGAGAGGHVPPEQPAAPAGGGPGPRQREGRLQAGVARPGRLPWLAQAGPGPAPDDEGLPGRPGGAAVRREPAGSPSRPPPTPRPACGRLAATVACSGDGLGTGRRFLGDAVLPFLPRPPGRRVQGISFP